MEVWGGSLQSQSLFYWITYSYFENEFEKITLINGSQSLFYWITYSYKRNIINKDLFGGLSQSLFYWITYSYFGTRRWDVRESDGLNPYFIGLPILISMQTTRSSLLSRVSILILLDYLFLCYTTNTLFYIHCKVSILILLDYLFLYGNYKSWYYAYM
mgnify:CR=1 FL=1